MRQVSNWVRERIGAVSTDTFTKTLANLFSDQLKPYFLLFLMWLGTFVGSFILGILNTTIQLPFWLCLIVSLVLLLLPGFLSKLWWAIRANGLQLYEGVLWQFELNRLIDEGPFCPHDRRTLNVIQSTHGFSEMIDMMELQRSNSRIKLQCPQCDFEVSLPFENLVQLRL